MALCSNLRRGSEGLPSDFIKYQRKRATEDGFGLKLKIQDRADMVVCMSAATSIDERANRSEMSNVVHLCQGRIQLDLALHFNVADSFEIDAHFVRRLCTYQVYWAMKFEPTSNVYLTDEIWDDDFCQRYSHLQRAEILPTVQFWIQCIKTPPTEQQQIQLRKNLEALGSLTADAITANEVYDAAIREACGRVRFAHTYSTHMM